MSENLTLSVRFNDEDMVLLQADVATAGFQGRTEAYSTWPRLNEWLAALRGFSPAQGSEVRFDAGAPDGLGHIGVVLSRLDWSGHCACRVSLLADQATFFNEHPHNTLEVKLVVEPAAIARFVKALEQMVTQQAGEAILQGLAQG